MNPLEVPSTPPKTPATADSANLGEPRIAVDDAARTTIPAPELGGSQFFGVDQSGEVREPWMGIGPGEPWTQAVPECCWIEYRFTPDDYMALSVARDLRGYSTSEKTRFHLLVALATGLCSVILFFYWKIDSMVEIVGLSLILMAMCVTYWWGVIRGSMVSPRTRFARESPLNGVLFRWELDDQGIRVTVGDMLQEQLQWKGVQRCVRTESGYFIDNIAHSYWIPRRVFRGTLDEYRFSRQLTTHVPACHNFKPPKCAKCGYDLRGSMETSGADCPECGN